MNRKTEKQKGGWIERHRQKIRKMAEKDREGRGGGRKMKRSRQKNSDREGDWQNSNIGSRTWFKSREHIRSICLLRSTLLKGECARFPLEQALEKRQTNRKTNRQTDTTL